MTLDNMMTMAQADRYTEDGQKTIQDARRTYKVNEISEKTGLQKQADGSWAPPKNQNAGAGEKKEAATPAKEKTFTFTKAGHVYNVPASSPAEAVQKLKARGVKGFKESDAFDDSTPRAGSSEKNAVGQNAESFTTKMKSEGWKNSGFDPAPGGRSFGVFSNGDKKIKVGVNAEGKIESVEEVNKDVATEQTARKPVDNTTAPNFKEGQRIPNAGALEKNYKHREKQYLDAHKKEAEANPKEVTERREVLASLVANARQQAAMFDAVNGMGDGEGQEWEINSHVAEELNKLNQEEKKLQTKLNELEKPTGGEKNNGTTVITAPKNAGRGDYIKIGNKSIRIERAEEGRYGNELGTLLQYEDPETGTNRFVLQSKNGTAKDVTKEYLNGAYDSAPLTGDTRIKVRK